MYRVKTEGDHHLLAKGCLRLPEARRGAWSRCYFLASQGANPADSLILDL